MAKVLVNTIFLVPDRIEEAGVVRRISWHAIYEMYDDVTFQTSLEAHYFGTLPANAPMPVPFNTLPTFTHPYVSLPADMSYIGAGAADLLYQIGEIAGVAKEGLGSKYGFSENRAQGKAGE